MKQLTCELCGGTNFAKQEGFFVCQNCGTKYSVEEARKIMSEGTGDDQGDVKAGISAKVENYFSMAQNAYDAGNKKEAEQYCNKVVEIDPTHSRAWLLKGMAAAWQSTLAHVRVDEFINCVEKAFETAPTVDALDDLCEIAHQELNSLILALNKLKIDHVVSFPKVDTWKDYIYFPLKCNEWNLKLLTMDITAGLAFKKGDEKVERRKINHPEHFDRKRQEELISAGIKLWNQEHKKYTHDNYPSDYDLEHFMDRAVVAKLMLQTVVPSDRSKIEDADKNNIIRACKNLIIMEGVWMNLKSYTYNGSYHSESKSLTMEGKKECYTKILDYHEVIHICDPSYVIPEVADPTQKKSGCYVATCVYGSYDCPQVWTLRRFRDNTLGATWYGRLFIRTYYAVSPTLVKWFGKTKWFQKFWKGKLDRMVAKLQENGVEDTPYEDKNW